MACAARSSSQRSRCCLIHLGPIFAVWDLDGHQPLRFVAGAEDEDAYLRRSQPYVDAYRALARQATAGARVLVVGEPRVFDLDRPAIWSSIVDPPPFAPFTVGPPAAPRHRRRAAARGGRAAGVP